MIDFRNRNGPTGSSSRQNGQGNQNNGPPSSLLKSMLNALFGAGNMGGQNGQPGQGSGNRNGQNGQSGQPNSNGSQNGQSGQPNSNGSQNGQSGQPNLNGSQNGQSNQNSQNNQSNQNSQNGRNASRIRPKPATPIMLPPKPLKEILDEYAASYPIDAIIRVDADLSGSGVRVYYLRGNACSPDQYNIVCDGAAANTVSSRMTPYYVCDGFWIGVCEPDLLAEFPDAAIRGYAFI